MSIEIGTTVRGTVVRITDYGAIVRLPEGITGLVHISEIAETYVRDVHDYLREDDEITVKILRINDKGRYELSVKQASGQPVQVEPVASVVGVRYDDARTLSSQIYTGPSPAKPAASFEDRLSRFLKDSEERQHDLKRHQESKRGRR